MFRTALLMGAMLILTYSGVVQDAEELKNEISSEATCGATPPSGERNSKTSDWTKFTVPEGYVINKDKTKVDVISERGSEHWARSSTRIM